MTLIENIETANISKTVRSLDSIPQFKVIHTVTKGAYLRPANASAYVSGDVISDSDETAKVIVFPDCAQVIGGSGEIVRCYITTDVNFAVVPDLELFIFDEEPTNHLDNAAFSLADSDYVIAYLSLMATDAVVLNAAASPDGRTAHVSEDVARGYVCEPTSKNLYGLLVTRTGFTPISGMKIEILLDLEID